MGAPSGYKLERKWSFTHFLIGVFGALAILGVMAKIFTFEAEVLGYSLTWKPVVLVGFMGEAFVFILMGMMREFRYVPVDEEEESSSDPTSDASENGDLDLDIQDTDAELSQETRRLVQKLKKTREVLTEQVDALEQLGTLRGNLEDATESLSKQSGSLGERAEDLHSLYEAQTSMAKSVQQVQEELVEQSGRLADEIEETQQAMKTLRAQFAHVTSRFEQFNAPSSGADRTDTTVNSTQPNSKQ